VGEMVLTGETAVMGESVGKMVLTGETAVLGEKQCG